MLTIEQFLHPDAHTKELTALEQKGMLTKGMRIQVSEFLLHNSVICFPLLLKAQFQRVSVYHLARLWNEVFR